MNTNIASHATNNMNINVEYIVLINANIIMNSKINDTYNKHNVFLNTHVTCNTNIINTGCMNTQH